MTMRALVELEPLRKLFPAYHWEAAGEPAPFEMFEEIGVAINEGRLPDYKILFEKASGSAILYEKGIRDNLKPIAVRVGEFTVEHLPKSNSPHANAELINKLWAIQSRITPAAMPA